jgi:hypothetical protein
VDFLAREWEGCAVPWKLKSLTVGWPPQAVLEPDDTEETALHVLFTYLAGKRLLRYGYGTVSGVNDLEALRDRADRLRDGLFDAMAALPKRAPIAEWLRKLEDASHDLLNLANGALNASGPAPPVDEVAPAVNELREAFAVAGAHVSSVYKLPAAGHLTDVIRKDLRAGRETSS